MLCDIITDVIDTQPDMQVVGDVSDRAELLASVEATQSEVVVLGLSDAELPPDCVNLFNAHPQVRLLGVAADGRRAFLYELRPQRTPLGEISPQGLLAAIRLSTRSQTI